MTRSRRSFLLLTLSLLMTGLLLAPVNVVASDGIPDGAHDCLIEPLVLAEVGSPTQGIVARLLVDRGASVVSGQPLLELESGIERAMVEQAAARAEMNSEVITRKADLALAELDSKRFADLHDKRLAPAQQNDEAAARLQVAQAALVHALENRQLQQLELQRSRRALARRTIRSPIDGVVVRQLVFPGELVFDNPVISVAQLSPLRVEVVLPARLFGSIRKGDTATIYPEINADVPLSAQVEVVDPLLDARSGTFGVRLVLPNDDMAIPAGQKCRVSFRGVHTSGALQPALKHGERDSQRDSRKPASLGAAVSSPEAAASSN